MKIDAHHHFWIYDPVEYDWIGESMAAIRRNFLPKDLEPEIRAAGIDGVISVQARMTLKETNRLLELASQNDFIKAVVGWVPLDDAQLADILDRYAEATKLRAVRHVVQGQPSGFLDRKAFNRGIRELTSRGLAYDLLIFESQLEEAIRFVDRHPNQLFVLDQMAKPKIKDNEIEPWAANIRQLAERDHVSCKLSGMVTEADFKNWSETQLQPYLDTCLEAFTPERFMFGSDWPVGLVAARYRQWTKLTVIPRDVLEIEHFYKREITAPAPFSCGSKTCRLPGDSTCW